ncbi:CRISPR-associated protein, Csy3 family [Chromohalobacter canadensis]|uniref:CRISPR-associated protein, Csy3 family n=1 Tax=Chromohalobacter canadensis TaxID=141389 RepID=A0A285VD06_9GAMM|nr:type I-F CRISPR-associated protein Csy3 [Chromohalobacter canadensis]SOC51979.1 CRISPR-associated protein, Csy3 family [Chromohalobacter canadensis]
MAKKDDALKTASVLAFERKLDPSDALLYAGQWSQRDALDDWQPVTVREKSVRGTISNRLKAKEQDPAKLDAAIENPNLQTVDVATLPHDTDTLMARFTLRVLGGAGTPSACNNADYQAKLQQAVTEYVQTQGFNELARRYAHNLANGRFLWRNRIGAEQVEVRIRRMEYGKVAQEWTFDALSLSLRGFDSDTQTSELAQDIADALTGKRHLILEVIAFAHVGNGQEVFPSQELILERGRGDKSKTLYQVGGVAGIHSQKLGNAIRTIDTWYPTPEDGSDLGPIAVEPYGSVTTQGSAYRQPKQKVDFYSLLDNWMLKNQVPNTEQQHFVMATLIRGGVFGEAG